MNSHDEADERTPFQKSPYVYELTIDLAGFPIDEERLQMLEHDIQLLVDRIPEVQMRNVSRSGGRNRHYEHRGDLHYGDENDDLVLFSRLDIDELEADLRADYGAEGFEEAYSRKQRSYPTLNRTGLLLSFLGDNPSVLNHPDFNTPDM